MIDNRKFIIWITLFVGLCIQIIPWTSLSYIPKPHWVMLVLIYWLITLPHRISIGTAFFIGAILDLFAGSYLGMNAFIFSVIAYLSIFKAQIIKNLALWQQSLFVIILSLCYTFLSFIFELNIYHTIFMDPFVLLSSLADGILWILVYLSLQQIRIYFVVN